MAKSVKFTEDEVVESSFKTYPRNALRTFRLTKAKSSDGAEITSETRVTPSHERDTTKLDGSECSLVELATDVHHRYRPVTALDAQTCFSHFAKNNSGDMLVRYSVLNTLLKQLPSTENDFTGNHTTVSVTECVQLITQASDDFNKLAKTQDVLDARTLQQIMRTVESLWQRWAPGNEPELSVPMRSVVQACVGVIANRPNSKMLLSSAIRLGNIGVEEKWLTEGEVLELVRAFSSTQFAFTASFNADVVATLSTVNSFYTTQLDRCADWVPLAVRGLVSSSSLTRSTALKLIERHDSEIISVLNESPEQGIRGSFESEPLARTTARKLADFAQTLTGEDAVVVLRIVLLVLNAATADWVHTDSWIDLLRHCLRCSPRLIPIVWPSVLNCTFSGPKYYAMLIAPFAILNCAQHYADETYLHTMLMEVLAKVDVTDAWEPLVAPLLTLLANNGNGTASAFEFVVVQRGLQLSERNLSSYLNVFDAVCKQANRQKLGDLETVWCAIAKVAKSRTSATEVVKYHYRVLATRHNIAGSPVLSHNHSPRSSPSQSPSKSPSKSTPQSAEVSTYLGIMLASGLIKTWDYSFLTKKHKQTAHSLLTLILLPVMSFLSGDQRIEYIDSLQVTDARNQSDNTEFMMALLATIEIGSHHTANRWMDIATIIQEDAPKKVILETLLAFNPFVEQAESAHWKEWRKLAGLFDGFTVLSKLPNKLPNVGIQQVLTVGSNDKRVNEEKLRVLLESINKDNIMLIRETASRELVDALARALVKTSTTSTAELAWELIPRSRSFVVAKSLLLIIDEVHNAELVEFWNSTVGPNIPTSCPEFLTHSMANRLNNDLPKLKLPRHIVMPSERSGIKRSLEKSATTPPSTKKPRRNILTGVVPVSLSALNTPPGSDASEELPSFSSYSDDLCSSPPPRTTLSSGSTETVPRGSHDKARLLKRLLMGLKMDEALQRMKRSEQQMIYNLLFKSCISLKTHLAETGEVKSAEEVAAARQELEKTIQLRDDLFKREHEMIETGRRERKLVSDSDSDSDDEYIDSTLGIKGEVV